MHMAKEYLMMNADQPIKSNADDKLNRASFAKNVAEAVVLRYMISDSAHVELVQ